MHFNRPILPQRDLGELKDSYCSLHKDPWFTTNHLQMKQGDQSKLAFHREDIGGLGYKAVATDRK